jgi:hypothetical protein
LAVVTVGEASSIGWWSNQPAATIGVMDRTERVSRFMRRMKELDGRLRPAEPARAD